MEKKLDSNYTRMLRAISIKFWRQHLTKQQLYSHLPFITKTIQVRRIRQVRYRWRSRDELISDVLLWTPSHTQAKAGRRARTYLQQICADTGVVLKTSRKQQTIEKGGEKGSGISVLLARHNDDDIFSRWKKYRLCVKIFIIFIVWLYKIFIVYRLTICKNWPCG